MINVWPSHCYNPIHSCGIFTQKPSDKCGSLQVCLRRRCCIPGVFRKKQLLTNNDLPLRRWCSLSRSSQTGWCPSALRTSVRQSSPPLWSWGRRFCSPLETENINYTRSKGISYYSQEPHKTFKKKNPKYPFKSIDRTESCPWASVKGMVFLGKGSRGERDVFCVNSPNIRHTSSQFWFISCSHRLTLTKDSALVTSYTTMTPCVPL